MSIGISIFLKKAGWKLEGGEEKTERGGKDIEQQNDKLVFEREHCKLPVIANQSADWCGNPPVEWNQVSITAKNRVKSCSSGNYSVHFTSNRGIATTSVRTGLAMTGNFGVSPTNNNLSV